MLREYNAGLDREDAPAAGLEVKDYAYLPEESMRAFLLFVTSCLIMLQK